MVADYQFSSATSDNRQSLTGSPSTATPKATVVMLTPNPWQMESRVIREATALAEAGYQVQVICDGGGQALRIETAGPVSYFCLPKPSFSEQVRAMLQAHYIHARVLARGLSKQATRPKAIGFLLFYFSKTILAILMSPAILLLQLALRGAPTARAKIIAPLMRATGLEATFQMNQFPARAKVLLDKLSPDIVHAHDLATLPAAFFRTAKNWKVVYDAHELETQTNTLAREPFRRRWAELYEAVLAPDCDGVITVSQSIAEWLSDTYRIARPTVIYNAPNVRDTNAPFTNTIRKALGLEAVAPLAVYVGSVTFGRGIEQSVEMLAYAPRLHLALVGPRHQPVEDRARTIAKRIDALDRLHFVDPVPSTDVPGFISDADCSLVTIQNTCLSYYFSFPNKLLESVFAGVPVVGARLKELGRFLSEFPAGIIADETDPAALAGAVAKIGADPAKYSLTANQRGKIAEIYGWPTQKAKLIALYAELSR